ncbi:MAG: hypothetical protein KF782_32310 [Labilithrix sp.]|nr:hypothetical protein [Labilithrix sp.]
MAALSGSVGATCALAAAASPPTKPAPAGKPGASPATKPPAKAAGKSPASQASRPAGRAAPAPKRAPPPPPPPPPLAILPSVARVKLTSHGAVVAVVEDVNLPRGEWRGESLRFHVAFGAPGPRAIDARLIAVGDGELEPPDDDDGEALTTERVPRRPRDAHALLGRETMAGIVVRVDADALGRAFARGNMAALRIRALVDAIEDASGAASVVVRLGASRGTPLTLGRLVAASSPPAPPLTRVEAKLCGPDADAHPLAVAIAPRPPDVDRAATIAPVLAVRHATDDLCVRLWSAPPAR